MDCQSYYVGCDIDAKSLRIAYRGHRTDYVMCDIQQLPFVKNGVQVILCSEVLEHLVYPYRVLADICETATETVVITFPEERILSVFKDRHPEHISEINGEAIEDLLISNKFKPLRKSKIFSSFIPCGVLEFLGIPRNHFTQTLVSLTDRLLKRITPSFLVPHTTVLVEAKAVR